MPTFWHAHTLASNQAGPSSASSKLNIGKQTRIAGSYPCMPAPRWDLASLDSTRALLNSTTTMPWSSFVSAERLDLLVQPIVQIDLLVLRICLRDRAGMRRRSSSVEEHDLGGATLRRQWAWAEGELQRLCEHHTPAQGWGTEEACIWHCEPTREWVGERIRRDETWIQRGRFY